jgi:hypothetical protein
MKCNNNLSDNPEKSEQQRKVEQAGINPALAGYDDVDLSQHIGKDELLASDVKPEIPDAQKKFVLHQKKLAAIRKIYNKFEVKDMTFEQFAKDFMDLTDPKKMQNDLAVIGMKISAERGNRSRINKALGTLN